MNNYDDTLDILKVMDKVPERDALLLADALLYAVYGWNPDKIGKMRLSSIMRYVEYAKKRMTWRDAYKIRRMLEKKEKPLWKKILKINS